MHETKMTEAKMIDSNVFSKIIALVV